MTHPDGTHLVVDLVAGKLIVGVHGGSSYSTIHINQVSTDSYLKQYGPTGLIVAPTVAGILRVYDAREIIVQNVLAGGYVKLTSDPPSDQVNIKSVAEKARVGLYCVCPEDLWVDEIKGVF